MEGCLKKLVLEAEAMGFWGLGKSGWKPLAVSRRKYWAGSAQLKANGFILTSRRAKKLIPVHVYNDPKSINGVALDRGATSIHEVTNAAALDYTSRSRAPATGDVVVFRNSNGFYAAVHVLDVKDDSRGDGCDELRFQYAIQTDGTESFVGFRDILEQ